LDRDALLTTLFEDFKEKDAVPIDHINADMWEPCLPVIRNMLSDYFAFLWWKAPLPIVKADAAAYSHSEL
jgi:hypothetical protein